MKRCPLAVLLIGLVLVPGPGLGDQDDPRLDDLFARLQAATEPALVERISRRIWALWRRHDDARVAAAMERGARALAAGQHARAETIYSDVIERDPGYAEGWNKRATARYLRGRYAAAAADIRRTLVLEPRHFGALAGLGLVYMEIGHERAALEAFREALAINPHLEGARANLEHLRRRLDDAAASTGWGAARLDRRPSPGRPLAPVRRPARRPVESVAFAPTLIRDARGHRMQATARLAARIPDGMRSGAEAGVVDRVREIP